MPIRIILRRGRRWPRLQRGRLERRHPPRTTSVWCHFCCGPPGKARFFSPRQGSLGHRSVHAHPGPVDAVESVVLGQARLPEAQKETVLHPGLEAVMRGGGSTKTGRTERVPLAAGAQHEKDGLGTGPIRRARSSATEKVRVLVRGQSGSISAQSSSVSPKQPPVLRMRLAWGRRRTFFLAGAVFTPLYRISPHHYSDRQ